MGENGALSASDVALLSGNNGGMWGDSSFMWIFALLILANGGFGNWGGNSFANAIGYENLATSNEVQRGFDNQNAMANQREILSAVTSGTAQTIASSTQNASNAINAIKDGNAALIREFGTVETTLTALAGKQQECCCEVLRGIDGVNYNGAINTAAINSNISQNRYESALNTAALQATIVAESQKTRDQFSADRIAEMQNKINQLELAQAVAGVVRYPSATVYGVPSPCFNSGCGCGNI